MAFHDSLPGIFTALEGGGASSLANGSTFNASMAVISSTLVAASCSTLPPETAGIVVLSFVLTFTPLSGALPSILSVLTLTGTDPSPRVPGVVSSPLVFNSSHMVGHNFMLSRGYSP